MPLSRASTFSHSTCTRHTINAPVRSLQKRDLRIHQHRWQDIDLDHPRDGALDMHVERLVDAEKKRKEKKKPSAFKYIQYIFRGHHHTKETWAWSSSSEQLILYSRIGIMTVTHTPKSQRFRRRLIWTYGRHHHYRHHRRTFSTCFYLCISNLLTLVSDRVVVMHTTLKYAKHLHWQEENLHGK